MPPRTRRANYEPPAQVVRAIPENPPDNSPPPATPTQRQAIAPRLRLVDWLTQFGHYSAFRGYLAASILHRCKSSAENWSTAECAATGVDFGTRHSLTVSGVPIEYWHLRAGTNSIVVLPTQMNPAFWAFMANNYTWHAFDNGEQALEWSYLLKQAFVAGVTNALPGYHGLLFIGEGTLGPLVDWLYWSIRGTERQGGDCWKFSSVKAFNQAWVTNNRTWPVYSLRSPQEILPSYPQTFLHGTWRNDFGLNLFAPDTYQVGGSVYDKAKHSGRGVLVMDPARSAGRISEYDPREDTWLRSTAVPVMTNVNQDFARKHLLALRRQLGPDEAECVAAGFDSINSVDPYYVELTT